MKHLEMIKSLLPYCDPSTSKLSRITQMPLKDFLEVYQEAFESTVEVFKDIKDANHYLVDIKNLSVDIFNVVLADILSGEEKIEDFFIETLDSSCNNLKDMMYGDKEIHDDVINASRFYAFKMQLALDFIHNLVVFLKIGLSGVKYEEEKE